MHLMKMMTDYCKLKEDFKAMSTQVTLAEPIIKLIPGGRTYFILTSSTGWTTLPFHILDRYKLCIRHKRAKIASVVLLKKDDELPLPVF